LEGNKWSKERLERAMGEAKEDFIKMEMELHKLLVKFCLHALKIAQKSKSEPLTALQEVQVIEKEIEYVIEDISRPAFTDLVIRATQLEFSKLQSEN